MAHDFRRLTDFLVGQGTDKVPHSHTPFLAHLIGVYKDLKEWGCEEHVVLAGLFHSIYGTEAFQGFALPLSERGTVRELIGEKAERLAYINCSLTRDSIDQSAAAGSPQLRNRLTDEPLPITEGEWRDLLTLHLCDRLEQVERMQNWEMRRPAWGHMAVLLGGTPQREYDRIFAGH
jgi:hypothetical protein